MEKINQYESFKTEAYCKSFYNLRPNPRLKVQTLQENKFKKKKVRKINFVHVIVSDFVYKF